MKFKINKEHFVTGFASGRKRRKLQTAERSSQQRAHQGRGRRSDPHHNKPRFGIRCSIKAEVENGGEITLPVKKFAQIVGAAPQQEITFESDDGQTAKVKSGGFSTKLNGLRAEEFPALPSFVDQHSYELPPQELFNMLRSVSYAKSSDENRYILNSVYFNFSEGKLTLVATDGKRMALVSRDMKIEQEDEGNVILPAKTVGELEKAPLARQGRKNRLQRTSGCVRHRRRRRRLRKRACWVNLPRFENRGGSYPNYKQVIPKEAEHRIKVDRELMLETVNRVAILTSDKQNSVKLTMSENSLEISTRSAEGDAKQAIEIEYSGPEVQIGFNPEFLKQPLGSISKDEVFFEFKDEMSPGVFKTLDNFMCVVMPLRI